MARVVIDPNKTHLGVTTEVIGVTPDLARTWLEGNVRNRNIRDEVVRFYGDEMKAGRWTFTGEPIQFDPDGMLLNGQHRLWAIANTGVTIPMLVVRGLTPESQTVMDTGVKRRPGDALSLQGEKNATQLSAAVRIAISATRNLSLGLQPTFHHVNVSNAEMIEWLEANPEMRDAVALAMRWHKLAAPSTAVLSYTTWRTYIIQPYETENFLQDAVQKVGLRQGDPVLALAQKFQDLRRSRKRTPKAIQISMTFRAWNARRKGDTLTVLRENIDGRPIPIPDPI